MNLKKIPLLVSAAIIAAAFSGAPAAAADSPDTVKIMPLGDSITDGYWTAGGYRKYLSHLLSQEGFTDIDLVGPKGNDTETFSYNGETVSYDGNYAGYSGYAIQYMDGTETRQGILETIQETDMIKTYQPDIVLLQIGTNDILSAYNEGITDRLENLINVILSDLDDPGSVVFVSTVPEIDAVLVSDWLWAYGDAKWNSTQEEFSALIQGYVASYNSSVKQLAEKMQSEQKNVRFADIHSVLDVETDLYDGVHPNEQGYEKMGVYWADVIGAYLDSGNTEETTAATTDNPQEETTVPTTENQPDISPNGYKMADLIRLSCFITNKTKFIDEGTVVPFAELTAEQQKFYDMDGDGALDSLDVALLRRELQETARYINEKG